jgi:zinc transport system substrate-binding protein
MVFHPAWGYFADTYGLQQISIEVEGKEPGPRSLARLINNARAQGVKTVFVDGRISHKHANTVADAIGGRVVTIDPLAEDYEQNLRQVARILASVSQ